MHEEVEPAERLVDRRERLVDLLIARDVERKKQRVVQPGRQLSNVFFEALPLIRHSETSPRRRRRLRDGPRNRSFIGNADDQPELPRQIDHLGESVFRGGRYFFGNFAMTV